MKKFRISYDLTVDMPVDHIYPDQKNPDVLNSITASDVEMLIENSGGMERVIREWGLEDYGDLCVSEIKDSK